MHNGENIKVEYEMINVTISCYEGVLINRVRQSVCISLFS